MTMTIGPLYTIVFVDLSETNTIGYVCQDGQWGAYTIRPSESKTIAQAEAWLVKRKWRAWS